VRIALHTGETELRAGDYYGPTVNRCARLRAIAHGGQVLLSLTTAEVVRPGLTDGYSLRDMGSHRLKDLQQPERVFQLLHPSLPSDFPPLLSLQAFANNLPQQLTSFIGREREMTEVKRLLSSTRLLTLTGAGGCGKTRLALQVAADLVEEYPDGVWQVELAPLTDPSLVPQTVAKVLGVREEPDRSITETLTDYLQSRNLLLIMDNCEHLITPCSRFADSLLRTCPKLRVLATSREALNLKGEQAYRVPSLLLPEEGSGLSVERLQTCESAMLFKDRARLNQPSFMLTRQNAAAVGQVCRCLDGIPLAIELAAARVRAMPVEQIARRLDDRFHLLKGGSRAELPHHQTLQALIDWSYSLLSEQERALLRRLSVFAGGWTLEAAEGVCAGEGIEDWEVLDLLTALVDKSLVVYEEHEGTARYRLLETVRQYGREKLAEAGETEAMRRRHLDWFLQLAERAEPELESGEQAEWLRRLEAEHDNLRAALEWSEGETRMRLAGALWRFWMVHNHYTEGQRWLTVALEGNGDAPAALQAKAFAGAGTMAWLQGDYVRAEALHRASLAHYGEAADLKGMAFALNNLGAQAINQGNYARATLLYEEGVALAREVGDSRITGWLLTNLGEIARCQGNHARARTFYEESLALAQEVQDKHNLSTLLLNLGFVAIVQGNMARARLFLREGISVCREMDDRRMFGSYLVGYAGLLGAEGRPKCAVRLLGAADALHEAIHFTLEGADCMEHERIVAAARNALEEEAFAAAWAEGRAMTWEQAVEYALEEAAN
jgi:predicted ATPase